MATSARQSLGPKVSRPGVVGSTLLRIPSALETFAIDIPARPDLNHIDNQSIVFDGIYGSVALSSIAARSSASSANVSLTASLTSSTS